jgi:hypothetical protein
MAGLPSGLDPGDQVRCAEAKQTPSSTTATQQDTRQAFLVDQD